MARPELGVEGAVQRVAAVHDEEWPRRRWRAARLLRGFRGSGALSAGPLPGHRRHPAWRQAELANHREAMTRPPLPGLECPNPPQILPK